MLDKTCWRSNQKNTELMVFTWLPFPFATRPGEGGMQTTIGQLFTAGVEFCGLSDGVILSFLDSVRRRTWMFRNTTLFYRSCISIQDCIHVQSLGFYAMPPSKILFNLPRVGQFHRQPRRKTKVERARTFTHRAEVAPKRSIKNCWQGSGPMGMSQWDSEHFRTKTSELYYIILI